MFGNGVNVAWQAEFAQQRSKHLMIVFSKKCLTSNILWYGQRNIETLIYNVWQSMFDRGDRGVVV